ncbi:hypothetical protein VIAG107301_10680 [Vibrio agarivorans]
MMSLFDFYPLLCERDYSPGADLAIGNMLQ